MSSEPILQRERWRNLSLLPLGTALFLSGAAGIALELVWVRRLRLTFGSTTLAISSVLAAYMAGIAFGARLGGRRAPRIPDCWRAFGRLHLGIGLYAAALPAAFAVLPRVQRIFVPALPFGEAAFLRFGLVLAILLPATLLMGAALPVLAEGFIRERETFGSKAGLLYGLETAGGALGVYVTAFVAFRALGLRGTGWAAAGIEILVWGIVAVRPASAGAAVSGLPAESARGRRSLLLAAYGAVGFAGLALEVVWTRGLGLVLGASVYAFSIILAVFLAAIAAGSLVGRRLASRVGRSRAGLAAAVGVFGILSLEPLLIFGLLPRFFVSCLAFFGTSPAGVVATGTVVVSAAVGPAAFSLGALFPLFTQAIAGSRSAGGSVGDALFATTIGGAAGGFAAGFVLLPALGIRGAAVFGSSSILFLAAALILPDRRARDRKRTGLAAAFAAAGLLLAIRSPAWNRAAATCGFYRNPVDALDVGVHPVPLRGVPGEKILFYRDGVSSTVSVHRERGGINLRVDGKVDASTGTDMGTQVLLGEIPMIWGKRPKSVLVVGLASGVTAGSAALHGLKRLDVVEIEPSMPEASHFFDFVNHRPLENPCVRVIADDARSFLSATRQRYDVIISEPSNPWMTGASSLFTREFFRDARRALAPGGRICQWLQLYSLDSDEVASVLAAIRAEFPYVSIFAERTGGGDLLLLGSAAPLSAADFPDWTVLSDPVRKDLERIGCFSTADLWSLLRAEPSTVSQWARKAGGPNSDDNMRIELEAPWRLYDWSAATDNWRALASFGPGPSPFFESGEFHLSGEQLGELALSYANTRGDAAMEAALVRGAGAAGAAPALEIAEADVELRSGARNLDATIRRLDEIVLRNPESFLARLYRARLAFIHRDRDSALEDVDRAIRLRAGDLRAHRLRLEILSSLGRSEEAWQEARLLLSSPYGGLDAIIHVHAAVALAGLGRFPEAIGQLRTFLDEQPQNAQLWDALARMEREAGHPEQEKLAVANASAARRNVVLALYERALQAERMVSAAAAVPLLKQALSVDPSYAPASEELRRLGSARPPQ